MLLKDTGFDMRHFEEFYFENSEHKLFNFIIIKWSDLKAKKNEKKIGQKLGTACFSECL